MTVAPPPDPDRADAGTPADAEQLFPAPPTVSLDKTDQPVTVLPELSGEQESVEQRQARKAALAANARSLSPSERVVPSWTDATVRRAADLIGGPLGRHALIGRMPILTPLRVALILALGTLILGWLVKSPCIQTGSGGGLDQGGNRPWITGCYNDTTVIYKGRGADQGHFIYSAMFNGEGQPLDAIEYPVVTSLWIWIIGLASGAYLKVADSTVLPDPLDYGVFFTIGAIALGLMYLWTVASTASMARRRPWDVLIMCLSPLLIVHAFTNWDLLALAVTAAAMAAWAKQRPVLAGVLIGIGVATKLYPVLLLGGLLVLCLRSGRMREFFITTGATVVAWCAINIPIMLLFPDTWKRFLELNQERGPEYSTLYWAFDRWAGSTLFDAVGGNPPDFLNNLQLVVYGIICLAIAWFALSVERRPRFGQLAFLLVAAFLLTNKVWSPQYSLWLLPLVVLALPKWRIVLIWQLFEAAVWYLLMPTFVTDSNGNREAVLSYDPFQAAVLVRDVIVVIMCVMVIRNVLKPDTDIIRISGDDDPTGGVLANTPDRFTVPSLPTLWRSFRDRGRPDERVDTSQRPEPAPLEPSVGP